MLPRQKSEFYNQNNYKNIEVNKPFKNLLHKPFKSKPKALNKLPQNFFPYNFPLNILFLVSLTDF